MPPAALDVLVDRPATRLATRLAFLIAGFGLSCWAPLVPFAKARLAVDDGVFGLLLLCLGLGSVGAMLVTGYLSTRIGNRPIIIAGAVGMSLILPLLSMASSPVSLAISLALFGASLGSLDVAMNIHAVAVEQAAKRPLMSGFHALFSLGGFGGAALMTALMSSSSSPLASVSICAALMLLSALAMSPRLLKQRGESSAPLSLPHGIVLLLAILAGITFLAEGAVLDWGALLITDLKLVDVSHGGLGYVLFSIAMTSCRLVGDRLTLLLGDRKLLLFGSSLAAVGFILVLGAPWVLVAMAGFLLIGFGAANVVPVLFRRAGTQRQMPVGLAVSAITTVGYAGVLLGPAMIGFVAKAVGLRFSFALLAGLLLLVTVSSGAVTKEVPAT
jgi:MFS family permease